MKFDMSDKIKNITISILFIFTISVVLIMNIVKKDNEISIAERRKLAKFPELSMEKFYNGELREQFDKYTMDQFVFRDNFRKIKAFVELNLFRKKDINNLYEYNGMIIKQEYPLNEKSVENIVDKINTINENYLNESNDVYYTIIPDKNYFADEKYLKMDYSKLQEKMNNKLIDMKYINIFECLNLEDFYYTDTHWKQENLKKVSDKISSEMNFKDRIVTTFEEKEITDFNGVYTGQLQVKTKQDTIKVLTNEIIKNSKVYNFETKKYDDIYNLEKVKSGDKYDIYLSGATPLLTIENKSVKIPKKLIVFRDSFGSSLVPLFTEAYSEIILIDTRYIATKYLKDLVEFENADVLFIYSTLVINNSASLK